MKKGMKLVCMVLTLAMLLGLLAGCGGKGGDDSNGGGSDQTLLLGLIGPMTGDYAHYGTSTRDGAQVAVEEINAAGGVNGWQLKLQTEDSQGDPDSAISAFGKLMDDKMDVSLGCVLSGEAQSVITAAKNDDLLIVTCTSMHSRNRRAGILIGQGKSAQEAMAEVGAVVEGYYAAESIYQLSQREGVEMPLCRSVYEVLYHGVAVQDVVSSLMRRAKKDELTETTWL